jgi:hypothetical protein
MFARRLRSQRHTSRHLARAMLALGALLALIAAPTVSRACQVQPLPEDADPAWVAVWREVDRKVRSLDQSGPCSVLELQLRGDRIEVVMTTRAGRRATRAVQAPFEIASTTDAMLVTLEDRSTAGGATPAITPGLAPALVPSTGVPGSDIQPPEKATTTWSRILVSGLGGVRLGGGLWTPTVGLLAALSARPWELGVIGQWETSYQSLGSQSAQRWSGSGVAVGLTVARRQPLGSQLEITGGGRFEGVVLHQETNHKHPEDWMMKADARVGIYAGAIFPRPSSVRFRMEVAVDHLLGSSPSAATDQVPPLPSWGATLAVGVEGNGP